MKTALVNPYPEMIDQKLDSTNPNSVIVSYIRHKDFRSSVRPPSLSGSGYPPWILKRAGLESSGQFASSEYWKTKRIAFFFSAKKNYIFEIFRFFEKK